MVIMCLASSGYSKDGSLKKKNPEGQETPASPEVVRFIARKF